MADPMTREESAQLRHYLGRLCFEIRDSHRLSFEHFEDISAVGRETARLFEQNKRRPMEEERIVAAYLALERHGHGRALYEMSLRRGVVKARKELAKHAGDARELYRRAYEAWVEAGPAGRPPLPDPAPKLPPGDEPPVPSDNGQIP